MDRLISEFEVIRAIEKFVDNIFTKNMGALINDIKAIPSADSCEDAISRQAAIEAAMQDVNDRRTHGFNAGATRAANRIKLLPPVKPQEPKTGHWIDTDEWRETVDGFEQWGYFRKCSKCGYVFKFLEIDNYCPNCGVKMIKPQERSE